MGWGKSVILFALVLVAALCSASSALAQNSAPDIIEATAFTQPYRLLELASDTGGVVGKVHVEEGDSVQPEQVLVEFRAEVLKANLAVSLSRVETARVQVAASEVTAKTREADFDRVKPLFEKKIASAEDYDKAKLDMDLARLAVDNTAAECRMYELAAQRDQEEVNRTIIRAPLAGVVLRINKREGEAVQEHAPLLTLASVDPLYVICYLPIATVGRVRTGMKGFLALENQAGDQPLECTVIVADTVADAASGTYRVKLTLPNPEKRIAAGSKGTIRFNSAR